MWNSQAEELRDRAMWWAGALIILGAIGIGVYYRYFSQPPAPVTQKAEALTPPSTTSVEEPPPIEHPVPGPNAGDSSLPAVNASDQLVHDSLAGLIGARPIEQFLVPENIVRHIVATIDNLPRKKLAVEVRPVKGTPGAAIVSTQGDVTTLSEQNYARYAPFVRVVKSIDPKNFADVYFRLYPLFQHAYEDLGYPDKYFNDRLVQAIDDMLRAPTLEGPIQLTQPKVFYELADPDLEELSAGQKLLIRMGPANARIVKEKLRALRAEVVKNEAVKQK
jgi:hypothetical protein